MKHKITGVELDFHPQKNITTVTIFRGGYTDSSRPKSRYYPRYDWNCTQEGLQRFVNRARKMQDILLNQRLPIYKENSNHE